MKLVIMKVEKIIEDISWFYAAVIVGYCCILLDVVDGYVSLISALCVGFSCIGVMYFAASRMFKKGGK